MQGKMTQLAEGTVDLTTHPNRSTARSQHSVLLLFLKLMWEGAAVCESSTMCEGMVDYKSGKLNVLCDKRKIPL